VEQERAAVEAEKAEVEAAVALLKSKVDTYEKLLDSEAAAQNARILSLVVKVRLECLVLPRRRRRCRRRRLLLLMLVLASSMMRWNVCVVEVEALVRSVVDRRSKGGPGAYSCCVFAH
jgi:hypothetical protein